MKDFSVGTDGYRNRYSCGTYDSMCKVDFSVNFEWHRGFIFVSIMFTMIGTFFIALTAYTTAYQCTAPTLLFPADIRRLRAVRSHKHPAIVFSNGILL